MAGYSSWGPTESDTTEVTEYACMKLRADPTAKDLRINTEEAGGLEQRETEKHEPEPEDRAEENANRQEGQLALPLHGEVFHTFRCPGKRRGEVTH